METVTKQQAPQNVNVQNRIIGFYDQGKVGTTIICFCSIHGNEPSGTIAFKQVIDELERTQPHFRGRIIGLHGNITASLENERFIDLDLNRAWTEERVKMLNENYTDFPEEKIEDVEQKYLWTLIHQEIKTSLGPHVFIDLHTTSSESQAFISINDTLQNRLFALQFPLPIVLGLEEHLDGTILNYINELGYIALGVEGGQHESASTLENHESFIWSTIFFSGCMDGTKTTTASLHKERLAKDMIDDKKIFEVRHRHVVGSSDVFIMKPGYVNFQKIHGNEILAAHNNDPVKAPETGRIFMPLYQKKGSDGFFVVREIRKFWLAVSAFLRKRNFHRFVRYLPGVGKYEELDNTIVVNRKIARWYVIEFFHLLGFRRKVQKGSKIVFIRRPVDL